MAFSANTAIINGLGDLGTNSRASVFIYNNELYLIDGIGNLAFKYNSAINTWESNALFSTFEVQPPINQIPHVFTYNGELYLLNGNSTNYFNGYKWDGTKWGINNAIATGFSLLSYSAASVFFISGEMYAITGCYTGTLSGYKWNGTQWESNAFISNGLADNGAYTHPTVFYVGSDLYLINGERFAYYAYKWSGTQWVADTDIKNGLTVSGQYLRPSAFYYNSLLYLITGNSAGTFSGFVKTPDLPPQKLQSISFYTANNITSLRIILDSALTSDETLKAWFGSSIEEMINPLNLVDLVKIDDTTYLAEVTIEEGEIYYIRGEQWAFGQLIEQINDNGTFFIVPQKPVETINITHPDNYHIFTTPNGHSRNHGLIYYQSYIYGSARNFSEEKEFDIFKIKADDYSVLIQKTIYENKNLASGRIVTFDQIIQCKNFLWVNRFGFLIRINPIDLDYMVFSGSPLASANQPMATDGNYLFISGDVSVHKINTDDLINSFSSYNYDGSAPVALPQQAFIGECAIIQHHPTSSVYVHSAVVDSLYVYVALTTTSPPLTNGYDESLNLNFCHLQKIRKSDMLTVGDVIIPKSTDDMVQTGEYVFLAPELSFNDTETYFGGDWELFAVNKSNLSIKYLKALHSSHFDFPPVYRAGFGVFQFSNKISVQIPAFKHTIVIDISNVESWGENFPIGGATEHVYKFQLNGVDFVYPCNELVIDSAGWVHINTWQADTMIFKIGLSQLTPVLLTPTIQTTLIGSSANNATVGGYVIDEGMSAITDVGFRYGTDPEALSINVDVSPDTYDFQALLADLDPGIYYIQAWGVNTEGTWYGNIVVFSTYNEFVLANDNDDALLEWINENYGCSIRCVQDAPGVADGTTGTATDQDGNTYNTVVINQKRWFVENLKTTHYRDGSAVENITANTPWSEDADGAYCEY